MHKLVNVHGGWVAGNRFWDRDDDIAIFESRLREGAHILMVAQRRMGKTSLMREAARRLHEDFLCLFVDLQKARNAPDAVVELALACRPHAGLWAKTKGLFRNALAGIVGAVEEINIAEVGLKLRAGLTAGTWANRADKLLDILAQEKRPVVLLFDEVPIMVNRMLKGDDYRITPERRAEADDFMSWLRKATIHHQGKIRFVVAGSIGFEPVLRQAELSATINHFTPFELKPWDQATAEGCLDALANQYNLTFADGVTARMFRKLGCGIPHHVQMYFSHVHDHCRRHKITECSAEVANLVYKSDMLGTRGHAELTSYEERLKQVLGEPRFALALDLLTEAAVVKTLTDAAHLAVQKQYEFPGQEVAEVQREILWVLEHDGYVKPGRGGYRFVSKLLRDWWAARHKFGFIPILKRGR